MNSYDKLMEDKFKDFASRVESIPTDTQSPLLYPKILPLKKTDSLDALDLLASYSKKHSDISQTMFTSDQTVKNQNIFENDNIDENEKNPLNYVRSPLEDLETELNSILCEIDSAVKEQNLSQSNFTINNKQNNDYKDNINTSIISSFVSMETNSNQNTDNKITNNSQPQISSLVLDDKNSSQNIIIPKHKQKEITNTDIMSSQHESIQKTPQNLDHTIINSLSKTKEQKNYLNLIDEFNDDETLFPVNIVYSQSASTSTSDSINNNKINTTSDSINNNKININNQIDRYDQSKKKSLDLETNIPIPIDELLITENNNRQKIARCNEKARNVMIDFLEEDTVDDTTLSVDFLDTEKPIKHIFNPDPFDTLLNTNLHLSYSMNNINSDYFTTLLLQLKNKHQESLYQQSTEYIRQLDNLTIKLRKSREEISNQALVFKKRIDLLEDKLCDSQKVITNQALKFKKQNDLLEDKLSDSNNELNKLYLLCEEDEKKESLSRNVS